MARPDMNSSLHETLHAAFTVQHEAARRDHSPSLRVRRERLARIKALIENNAALWIDTISQDFGHRSAQVTEVADLFVLRTGLKQISAQLSRWMKPRRVSTPVVLQPASARIVPQPLGVVGVMSPWNYPLQLSLGPSMAALAAGNHVMLKPSPLSPAFSQALAEKVGQAFSPEEFTVIVGGDALGPLFAALPFDHLFFTGSTRVGRLVAQTAGANLTPVTLELGGKSPCIIDASCDLRVAMPRIVHGKLLNSGQTCIAPDHVYVPRSRVNAFIKAFETSVRKMFPSIAANPDYTTIISDAHFQRLQSLLADAAEQGATLRMAHEPERAQADAARKCLPTLVLGATPGMRVLREEIFGPILPVLPYDDIDTVLANVNAADRPLALYWFGADRERGEHVLANTLSGTVGMNDTLMQIAHKNLPFGGVGASGMGAYHGETGFRTFSKLRPVLDQSRFSVGGMLYPPYGRAFEQTLGMVKKLS